MSFYLSSTSWIILFTSLPTVWSMISLQNLIYVSIWKFKMNLMIDTYIKITHHKIAYEPIQDFFHHSLTFTAQSAMIIKFFRMMLVMPTPFSLSLCLYVSFFYLPSLTHTLPLLCTILIKIRWKNINFLQHTTHFLFLLTLSMISTIKNQYL